MRILLTNDDGYNHPLLLLLERVLQDYGEVFVVAPSLGMSGAGCGINTFRDMRFYQEDEHHYHVDGTPADCVQYADVLVGDVDLVVSGVNNGYNLSNDIMYSGTCGAAFQSVMFRRKAIAMSAEVGDDVRKIERCIRQTLDYVLANDLLSSHYFLNANFPSPEYPKAKGIQWTRCFLRRSTYELRAIDESDRLYHLQRFHNDDEAPEGTDVRAIREGYISLTPLGPTCYRDEYLEEIRSKIQK